MVESVQLDPGSPVPLYRQLYEQLRNAIHSGKLAAGHRLPPTRELAGRLGLNRTTVSAAYALLEADSLIEGQVGRGSFIRAVPGAVPVVSPQTTPSDLISFASSRPADHEFPLASFQEAAHAVTSGPDVTKILQLGSPLGYGPLRTYLLEQSRLEGCAGPEDDILITSGCQQAFDLIQRALVVTDRPVIIEDPVYHGLRNVFTRAGVKLRPLAVTADGIDFDWLTRVLETERPSFLVLTPTFQNPTGTTLDTQSRRRLIDLARRAGVMIVENDIYGALRYRGESLPTIKQLDPTGGTLLLRSFSKVAFPGLRVGWVIGPKPLISRLAEARQWCDLHGDQLSQAILLRFCQTGALEGHLDKVRTAGATRLDALELACREHLPSGCRYRIPEGGMNMLLFLPEAIDATAMLAQAERAGITYVPGNHFAVERREPSSLRLSFGSLTPQQISEGIARLGQTIAAELNRSRSAPEFDHALALV